MRDQPTQQGRLLQARLSSRPMRLSINASWISSSQFRSCGSSRISTNQLHSSSARVANVISSRLYSRPMPRFAPSFSNKSLSNNRTKTSLTIACLSSALKASTVHYVSWFPTSVGSGACSRHPQTSPPSSHLCSLASPQHSHSKIIQ